MRITLIFDMGSQKIRKILRQEYSYLITLPIFWIEESGLEEGGYVEVSLGKDGALVLMPYEEDQDES